MYIFLLLHLNVLIQNLCSCHTKKQPKQHVYAKLKEITEPTAQYFLACGVPVFAWASVRPNMLNEPKSTSISITQHL